MSQTARIRRTSVNALTNYLRFFITMIISFWLIPFIIKSLGQDLYGLWTLSFSIIGFFSLLDFGFGLGVVKWTGESRVSGDSDHRNRMLSTVFFVYVAIALVGMALLAVFSIFYGRAFSIPDELRSTAVAVLLLLGLRSLAIQIPMSLFKGVLFGEQKITWINIIQIFGNVLYAVSAWVALRGGMGVVWLATVNCLSFAVENLLYLVLAYRKVDHLRISVRLIGKRYMREAASFSFYSFLTTIAGLVLFQTDSIIIQLTLGLELVGLYAVAIKITEYSFLLTKQLVNVLTPLISELKAGDEQESLRYLLTNLSRYLLATAVVLGASVQVFAGDLLVHWVGPGFAEARIPLIILMCSYMITIPELVASNVLTMTGHHKFTARVSLVSIVVNIATSLALVGPLGLTGIAIGTLASTTVCSFILTLGKAAKEYGFPWRRYLTSVYLPTLLPAVPLVAVGMLAVRLFPVVSLWDMMVKAIPGACVYALLFWLLGVDRKTKALVRQAIRRKRMPAASGTSDRS